VALVHALERAVSAWPLGEERCHSVFRLLAAEDPIPRSATALAAAGAAEGERVELVEAVELVERVEAVEQAATAESVEPGPER
jgi:hypothetical protein